MSGSSSGNAKAGGRARTLAEVYRRFGEVDGPKISPVYGRIAIALSESDEALRVIETAPARKRHPTIILAALHDLALAGHTPALAEAFAAANAPDDALNAGIHTGTGTHADVRIDAEAGAQARRRGGVHGDVRIEVEAGAQAGRRGGVHGGARGGRDVGAVAVEVVVGLGELVVGRAVGRRVRADEGGRHAVLYPAVAEVARRVGAGAIGLIDVGRAAGLNLTVDRVGISYGNGQSLGDARSAVQVSASVVGAGAVPSGVMPEVVTRVVVDVDPVDVTDADEARWLRACVPPDQVELSARLGAELAFAAADLPVLLRGEVVDVLPEAIARVPDDVLPVVITTWALSALDLEGRLRFLQRLDEAATRRPVAWVSVEGVGVAPGIPTFGDRRASGHSIVGMGVFEHAQMQANAVGRCWLRGEMVAWLADDN